MNEKLIISYKMLTKFIGYCFGMMILLSPLFYNLKIFLSIFKVVSIIILLITVIEYIEFIINYIRRYKAMQIKFNVLNFIFRNIIMITYIVIILNFVLVLMNGNTIILKKLDSMILYLFIIILCMAFISIFRKKEKKNE